MGERDDEDLAIDQLATPATASGRTDDPSVARARALAGEPAQEERAAARAEPQTTQPPPSQARLRELRERIEQLQAQQAALPTRELRRIDDLDARASILASQHDRYAERLAALPEPTRRWGRQHDPHAAERAELHDNLAEGEHGMREALTERARLERELGGDPGEIRAERDGVQRALFELTREQRAITRAERRARERSVERESAMDLGL